jgi:hypothetical protein
MMENKGKEGCEAMASGYEGGYQLKDSVIYGRKTQ